MLWIILTVAAILVVGFLIFSKPRKPALVATITMNPDGANEVEFSNDQIVPDHLCRLLMCYIAKIRWLLFTEPQQLTEIFHGFLNEVDTHWPEGEQRLLENIPGYQELLERITGNPVSHGVEHYVVRYSTRSRGGHITNDLPPQRGFAVNIILNYFILLDAAIPRLPDDYRTNLRRALVCFTDFSNSAQAPGNSLSNLFRWDAGALGCWDSASRKIRY